MTERDALDVARVLLKKAGQDEALVRKIGSDTTSLTRWLDSTVSKRRRSRSRLY